MSDCATGPGEGVPPWSLSLEEGWPERRFFQASFARKGALFSNSTTWPIRRLHARFAPWASDPGQHEVSLISPGSDGPADPQGLPAQPTRRGACESPAPTGSRVSVGSSPSDTGRGARDLSASFELLSGDRGRVEPMASGVRIATDSLILIAYGARRTDDDWLGSGTSLQGTGSGSSDLGAVSRTGQSLP